MKMGELTSSASVNFKTCVAFLVLTTVAGVARAGSRLSIGGRPSGPDWLCLLSLLFFYGYCIVIFNFIFNVSHFKAFDFNPSFPLDETRHFLLAVFLIEILFTLAISSVKLSILWFYHSIFHVKPIVNRLIFGVGVICIIWFLIAIFPLIIFQCHPVDALWNQFDAPPACLESQKILLGYELSNFFIDIAILSIPVATVRQLQLSRTRKIGISATFLLGGLVCIASIVRLTYIYDVSHPSRPVNSSPSIVWSTVQAGVAIICSCLPTYGPLVASSTRRFRSLTSQYHSNSSRGNKSGNTGSSSLGGGRRLQDLSRQQGESWTQTGFPENHGHDLDTWNSDLHKSNEHILQPLPSRDNVVSSEFDVV
ncbi:hypothetical protein F5Y03DRAFT_254316 [Xylaria venustula]|nr:hypothetical protein F5Y03DRAFT_254316 [Xylaria venustula]